MPCCRLLTFFKTLFFKNSFRNTTRGSKGLDPDQDRCFVIPGLGSNCLQRLSAGNKSLLGRSKTCLKRPLKKKAKNWFSRPIIA